MCVVKLCFCLWSRDSFILGYSVSSQSCWWRWNFLESLFWWQILPLFIIFINLN
jgi:hypothetical protein